jgi:hypothetical protein
VSFTTSAPAASACLATSGRAVSTEITASVRARAASMTGMTRSSSTASVVTRSGENGAPPTSSQSAPSDNASPAAATAASKP